MTRFVGAVLATLALLLAGCGQADSGDTGTDSGGPSEGPVVPQGSDDVVLRIESAGGFVPVDYAFANGPTLLVTGDGRVLQPAAIEGGTPQPSLKPYLQHSVDAATLQDLLRRAEQAGLLAEPPDYQKDMPPVTDMPSTTVEITADGKTWSHSAYALGFEEEKGVRAALADFVDEAHEVLDDPDAEPYQPEALRLTASEPTGVDDYPVVTEWPAAVDLTGVGECTVVDDPAAVADVVETMSSSPDDTLFRQDGRSWSVTAALVLPGETRPCADW